MRLWQRGQVAKTEDEFETHQQRLTRLSGEMLDRYRSELDCEISDPARLAAVYGAEFASAGIRAQAQNMAMMAASMLQVPNALVTVIVGDEQETIAAVGSGNVEPVINRQESFCQHVIGTGREFAVSDAAGHSLVCSTNLAKNGSIVSYLGVPIVSHNYIVGVLCVYDDKHRDWTVVDVGILTQLAAVLTRATQDA